MTTPLVVKPEEVTQAREAQASDPAAPELSSGAQPATTVEVPEFLKGQIEPADYAALSDKERTHLESFGKKLYGDYTRKNQEIAEMRRLQEDLLADPDKATHLKKALTEYEARKQGLLPKESTTVKEASTRLDALLEQGTPEQREAMRSLVDAFDERYQGELKASHAQVAKLEQQLKGVLEDTTVSRETSLKTQLSQLPEGLKALGERYEDAVLRMGKAPGGTKMTVGKLLQIIASEDEYRQAVVTAQVTPTKALVERTRQTATAKPSTAVGAAELAHPTEDRTPSKGKQYGQTWKTGNLITKMLGEIRRGMPGA